MEQWKDIKGYEGIYQISSLGRIRSLDRVASDKNGKLRKIKGTIRKTDIDKYGYEKISLCKNNKYKKFFIHRLVAQTFIGDIPEGYEVNHIDYNPLNNNYLNLEIVSHLDNIRHSYNNGHYEGIHDKKVLIEYIDGNSYIFNNYNEACKHTGISKGGLTKILNKARSGNLVMKKLGIKSIQKYKGVD